MAGYTSVSFSADQDGEHAGGLVVLDEAHPPHVGRQIEHPTGVVAGQVAAVLVPKIEL